MNTDLVRPQEEDAVHGWTYILIFHVGIWLFYGAVYLQDVVNSGKPADYWKVVLVGTISGSIFSFILAQVYHRNRDRNLITKGLIALAASMAVGTAWSLIRVTYSDYWYEGRGLSGWPIGWRSVAHSMNSLLFWSAMYFVYEYYNLLKRKQIQALRAQALARQNQLKLLSYQLNPHFLFNVLNSIAALVLKDDNKKAHRTIVKLSDFLRYTLYEEPWKKVTLKEELECIERYLEIQSVRFGDRLRVSYDISGSVSDARLPNLILQPIIENAIKHTISSSGNNVEILVSASKGANNLHIEISNSIENGENVSAGGRGMGLSNVRERIHAYYGEQAVVRACRSGNQYVVSLQMPYETEG